MTALCVDDEILLLEALTRAVKNCSPPMEVVSIDDEHEALQWAEHHDVDVAFLDIRLHDMDGLELAEKLRRIHPDLPIVFCTGYRDYALDAFQVHASGYLTKPIRSEAVQRELDHIFGEKKKQPLLRAQCFGSFEVFAGEEPLHFKRAKTKELLAYLIDRRGASVSARDLHSQLWEGEAEKKDLNYLHQLTSDLRKTLKSVGAEKILVSHSRGYSVDPELIDCDYYRFLAGEESAVRRFTGEYMTSYSWSEFTCAYLQSRSGVVPNLGKGKKKKKS